MNKTKEDILEELIKFKNLKISTWLIPKMVVDLNDVEVLSHLIKTENMWYIMNKALLYLNVAEYGTIEQIKCFMGEEFIDTGYFSALYYSIKQSLDHFKAIIEVEEQWCIGDIDLTELFLAACIFDQPLVMDFIGIPNDKNQINLGLYYCVVHYSARAFKLLAKNCKTGTVDNLYSAHLLMKNKSFEEFKKIFITV